MLPRFEVKLATFCRHYLEIHVTLFLCCHDFTTKQKSTPRMSWTHLAVCGGDHVDVVADQLESEAPVHEREASLQRRRHRRWMLIRPDIR